MGVLYKSVFVSMEIYLLWKPQVLWKQVQLVLVHLDHDAKIKYRKDLLKIWLNAIIIKYFNTLLF